MGENMARINATDEIRRLGGGGNAYGIYLWSGYQKRVNNNFISSLRSGDGSKNNYGIVSPSGGLAGMYLNIIFNGFMK